MFTFVLFIAWMLLWSAPLIRLIVKKRNAAFGAGRAPSRTSIRLAVTLSVIGLIIYVGAGTAVNFYTEALWFSDVGYLPVFIKSLEWGWTAWLCAFLTALAAFYANIAFLKRRINLKDKADFQNIFIAATVFAVIAAFLLAAPLKAGWLTLCAALNYTPFASQDPVFHRDISFYVFLLPAIELVNGFLLKVLAVMAAITAAVYGLQIGGFLKKIGSRTREEWRGLINNGLSHLAFIGGLYLFFMIPDVLSAMWGLLYTSKGTVFGANYVDVHYRIPAYRAVAGSLVFFAMALFAASRIHSLRMTIYACIIGVAGCTVFWVGGVVAVPKIVQAYKMRSNEIERERPYISLDIANTRTGYGVDDSRMTRSQYAASDSLDPAAVARNRTVLDSVRLWDWEVLQTTNTQNQVLRTYYSFPDVDVDRYVLGGKLQQIMLSWRELNQNKLPDQAKTWQNTRFVYTHGFGACANNVSSFTAEGLPDYLLKNIPPESKYPELELRQPRIYFGTETHEHVYVNTRLPEFDYPVGDNNATTMYDGPAGIKLDSIFRKLAFAVRFDGIPLLMSDEVTDRTRILFRRDIRSRVRAIAPFLRFDGDPLRVISDGSSWFIWDAYTTTDRFPYSEMTESAGGAFNYIRNSVKVTMNAYTGKVTFYVFDGSDPIIRTLSGIFPGMFRPASEMAKGLRAHIRYPEDLLQVQGRILTRYHMSNPTSFYNKEDSWDIARQVTDVNAREGTEMDPYYILTRIPGEAKDEFVLQLLFSPHSTDIKHPRGNMVGQLIGRCDGDNYGKLILVEFPKNKLVNGPLQIGSRISQHREISKDITLWNQQGSNVIMRRMVVLPLDDGTILYIQPIYLQSTAGSMPELKQVVVATATAIGYAPTFREALAQILTGGVPGGQQTFPTVEAGRSGPGESSQAALQEKLNAANDHLRKYIDLTAQGRLGDAGRELEQVRAILGGEAKR
ncbi:MAG TPA: UPF0182 family protein [Geobacteraceae bacterium]|nr:UPF0182 family protein [Geobacteraceae bacterium]